MYVIDFHSHFFGRTYFEALAAQSPKPGTVAEKLAQLAREAELEIPAGSPAEHLARWTAELDKKHVEHLCTFASAPEEIPAVVEAAALSKGRVSAFALVNPKVEGAAAKMRTLLAEKKLRGVLLFPALHQYKIDGAEAKELLGVLDEARAIAYVHCGLFVVPIRDRLGLPRTQDLRCADPLHLIPAANAHPNTTFVIPHFGAGFLRETLFCGVQCANVCVDTSSSNSWMATQAPKLELKQVFERALEVFGARRVLFGTDSGTFPKGWRRDRWEEQHHALTDLGASAADQELIFRANARRVLGLA